MRYRLPLELELAILELAAPPLAYDYLHDRVDYFINVRSPRPDEHERLKTRFEAGFGRDRPLRRLYLDMSGLPDSIRDRREPGTDSVSATIHGGVYGCVSSNGDSSNLDDAGEGAQEQACEAVASFVKADSQVSYFGRWELCTMITDYSQALDTLWLKLPDWYMDIKNWPPPRLLYINNDAFDYLWGWFGLLPLSNETLLFLRNINLCTEGNTGGYDTRHMFLHHCWATRASLSKVLNRFPHLETLVLFEPDIDNLVSVLKALPTPIRRVHILQRNFVISANRSDPPRVLPHLKSFTYTSLSSWVRASRMPTDDEPDADALADVQQAIKSIVAPPQCVFKYVKPTESPEEALANALATFDL